MSRYRLRVELPDLPGALAKVATVISDLDGDVVSIDIHELDGHHSVDELVVEVLTELDGRVLGAALEAADAGILLSCSPTSPTPEPVLDALSWARELAAASEPATVSRVLASACHSAKVWVASLDEAREVPAGRLALARGIPLVQRCQELPGPLARPQSSAMWLLAVPDGQPHARCIAFLARPGSLRFTASEVARADAVMALYRTLTDGAARRASRVADVAPTARPLYRAPSASATRSQPHGTPPRLGTSPPARHRFARAGRMSAHTQKE